MAKECASPTPFHVSARWGMGEQLGAAEQGATQAVLQPARMNSPLFDRAPTSAKPIKRQIAGGLAAAAKENAGVGYHEVRVERFGWRRNSFISRVNSPLLEGQ